MVVVLVAVGHKVKAPEEVLEVVVPVLALPVAGGLVGRLEPLAESQP